MFVVVHVITEAAVGAAELQLGCVFEAHDQTTAKIVNTSVDQSHHEASIMTSAP